MKWGRYIIGAGNIGDQAQLIGLDALYAYMGIDKKDTVDLNFKELHTYRGDTVICPIYGCHFAIKERLAYARVHAPSPDIIPVFLGFFAADFGVLELFDKFFKNTMNMPVLCRDEFTATVFHKWQRPAMFWGDLSLLAPDWTGVTQKRDTVFYEPSAFTNGESVDDFIPAAFRNYKKYELRRQDIMDDAEHMAMTPRERNLREYDMMLERERMLYEHGAYVIASSLHLTLPCISLGIPVLFKRTEAYSPRNFVPHSLYPFSNLDRFDPACLQPVPDITPVKKYLLKSASRVLTTLQKRHEEDTAFFREFEDMKTVMNLKKEHFKLPVINMGYIGLSSQHCVMDNFFYIMTGKLHQEIHLLFWGAGEIGNTTLQNLYEFVQQCKSFSFIDNARGDTGEMFGDLFPIITPDKIKNYDKDSIVIFITTYGSTGGTAEHIARVLEEEYGLIHGLHFYYYEYLVASMFGACFGSPAYVPSFYPPKKRL
jgi:hypothetical protein